MPGGAIRTLTVKWVGDVTGLKKAGNDAKGAFSSIVQKAQGMQGPLGGVLGKAATGTQNLVNGFKNMGPAAQAGVGAAATAVVGFYTSATKKAMEDAAAQTILARTLTNATGARASDIAGVEDWINKTQNATGVLDDQLRPALGNLVRATHDTKAAQDLLNIALDISAATGRDLAPITQALAKAQGGSYTALKKLVPTLDVTRAKQEGMVYVQKELNKAFGGSMAAAADTTEGRLKRLSARWEDFQEEMGQAVLPTLDAVAGGLNALGGVADKAGLSLGDLASIGSLPGLVNLGKRLFGGGSETNAATKAQKELNDAVKDYQKIAADSSSTDKEKADAHNRVVEAQKKQATVQGAVTSALDEGTEASKENTDATDAQAAATKRAEDRTRKYTEAVTGNAGAQLGLRGAQLNLNTATSDYEKKAKAAADQGFRNQEANQDWEEAAINVKQDILNVASSADQAAQKEAELRGHTYGARDSARAQRDALVTLRSTIAPNSPFRAYLDGLIRDLDRAADNRTGRLDYTVTINGQQIRVDSTGQLLKPVRLGGNLGALAAGGPADAGKPYVVGERGPEIFVPRNAGTVIPNGGGGTAARGVGTTVNYNLTLNVGGLGATSPERLGRSVVEAIRAFERRNGNGWRKP